MPADDNAAKSSLATLILAQRRNVEMTQAELAEAFGVQPQTVGRWETGARPQRRFWSGLADFLGLGSADDVEAIVNGRSVSGADSEERAKILQILEARMSSGEPLNPEEAELFNKLL